MAENVPELIGDFLEANRTAIKDLSPSIDLRVLHANDLARMKDRLRIMLHYAVRLDDEIEREIKRQIHEAREYAKALEEKVAVNE